ncbi:hypothetical protein [Bacillus velezensis]|uniref:hypothetical protein n=1 Tax=Bacillus velezensis TaxID=492670 RepID=UPI00159546DB|nr:hypothetical protein [Bacillus velezensis]
MDLALFFTLIDARRLLLPFTAVAFAVTRVIDAGTVAQNAQLKKPGCIRVFQAID